MQQRTTRPSMLLSSLLAAAVAGLTMTGCGAGDAPADWGQAAHFDIEIGSTEDGSGQLTLDYDTSEPVSLTFTQCIGGDGSTCTGGIALFSAEDPGWGSLEADAASANRFVLDEGTSVTLEVVAIDAGLSYFVNGVSLDSPGDQVTLGEAVEALHTHGEWQLALPGDTVPEASYALTLRVIDPSGMYSPSDDIALTLSVTTEE